MESCANDGPCKKKSKSPAQIILFKIIIEDNRIYLFKIAFYKPCSIFNYCLLFLSFSSKFTTMVLLGLSIAPGLAICLYILLKDVYNKEPKRLLLFSFFLGILSIIPPYFIETYSIPFFNTSIPSLATFAFC